MKRPYERNSAAVDAAAGGGGGEVDLAAAAEAAEMWRVEEIESREWSCPGLASLPEKSLLSLGLRGYCLSLVT